MAHQRVTTQSWGSRIMGSFVGALLGVALFIFSFPVLFWNEGRAVHTAKTLEAGASNVVSAAADKVDSANEGKLVHITAPTVVDETQTDKDFGVQAKAIRLIRTVEMYQYKEVARSETKKNLGGSTTTVTTYTHPADWSAAYQGNNWQDPDFKLKNPPAMPSYPSQTWQAEKVTAGAFELPKELIDRIQNAKPLQVAGASSKPKPPKDYKTIDNGFYKGADMAHQAIGDVRVTYQVVEPPTVSIVAVQTGKSFQPYKVEGGDPIELLEVGEKDAKSMFQTATEQNNSLTWILRVAGFLMMGIGAFLVMRPLSVIGDFIPFIGGMMGALLLFVALLFAAGLSLITIASGWVYYRPMIGIPLLAAGVGGLALMLGICIFRPRRRRVVVDEAPIELVPARPAAQRPPGPPRPGVRRP